MITEGCCGDEGLNDGRMLLIEAVRALSPVADNHVYRLLFEAAIRLGEKLKPKMEQLFSELRTIEVSQEASSQSLSREEAMKGVASSRFDGSSVIIQGQSTFLMQIFDLKSERVG